MRKTLAPRLPLLAFSSCAVLLASNAAAQTAPVAPTGPLPPAAPGGPTAPSTTTTVYTGPVAPTAPGGVLGGGNVTESSARPITGPNDHDTFDLGTKGGGAATVRGGENSSFMLGTSSSTGTRSSDIHTVRRGDTLWGICDTNFRNPYQWPRIWSYNPQIQNPHWIYPGDQVRLRPATGEDPSARVGSGPGVSIPLGQNLVDRRRQVPTGTVFLRNEGFIEDETAQTWGEITGSREDKMILSDYDEIYMKIADDHDVKLGQELTIFRPVRNIGSVRLVQIQGTVRVDFWNPKERLARGRIVETLDTIERGARLGPILRKFEVVPPKRNEVDITSSIYSSIEPRQLFGAHQIVFLNRGEIDGLKPGNRLFVSRQGDAWHQSLTTKTAAQRVAIESDDPGESERVPRPKDENRLPDELIGEIRVITTRQHTAMAIVTASRGEIEQGDVAVARKGY